MDLTDGRLSLPSVHYLLLRRRIVVTATAVAGELGRRQVMQRVAYSVQRMAGHIVCLKASF